MAVTKVNSGYGTFPTFMQGGGMVDPMAGMGEGDMMAGADPMGGMAPPPPSGGGGMEEVVPLIEQYMSAPDPNLADQIISQLATSLGIGMAPQMDGEGGGMPAGDPMGGGMPQGDPMAGAFKNGGKIGGYLKTLKL